MPHRTLLLTAFLAACATTPKPRDPAPPPERTPATIADHLADAAEVRANPDRMRVLVHLRPPEDPALASVAPELERDLVTALSGRFHLFDAGPAGATATTTPAPDLDELVKRLDVTHTLVCDLARKDGEVELSMRLLEHATRRIVATAQGTFPLEALTDESRVALSREPGPAIAAVPVSATAAEPRDVASTAASTHLEHAYEAPPSASATDEFALLDPAPSDSALATTAADPASANDTLPPAGPPIAQTEPALLPPASTSPQEPEAESDAVVLGPAAARLRALGISMGRQR